MAKSPAENGAKRNGATAAIRKVLNEAGVELSISEIMEALPATIDSDVNSISTLCRQRVAAGEFIMGIERGRSTFRINAEWNGITRSPKRNADESAEGSATSAVHAVTATRPVDTNEALWGVPESTFGPNARPVQVIADAPAPERAAVVGAEPTTRALAPLGLVDRLHAIAADIKSAISDACDEQIRHDAIKALVMANSEMQCVLRKLAA